MACSDDTKTRLSKRFKGISIKLAQSMSNWCRIRYPKFLVDICNGLGVIAKNRGGADSALPPPSGAWVKIQKIKYQHRAQDVFAHRMIYLYDRLRWPERSRSFKVTWGQFQVTWSCQDCDQVTASCCKWFDLAILEEHNSTILEVLPWLCQLRSINVIWPYLIFLTI